MLFIIAGVVVMLIAIAIVTKARVPGGVNAEALGWMSAQWLAEHRASRSP